MKNLLLGLILLISGSIIAQSTHTINFEPAGTGVDWNWVMSENDDNPPLEFITNPVSGGINTSSTVAKFTARVTGNPWALCFTDDDGVFTFDASNSTVSIMIYKSVISDVGIKFEGLSPAVEIDIPNTLTNQWELMTFDFSGSNGNNYSRIIIIPDFVARTQENIIYFDNIQVPDGDASGVLPEPTTAPPVPSQASDDVLSVYSEAYTNITGTDFNPYWGQSTVVTLNYNVAGNNTLKYENLNYQGTQLVNQDVSLFEQFHLDFWTPNATNLSFYLISATPTVEKAFTLSISQESWVSVDIPLDYFLPEVDLTDVFQFKVVGNGTVYFDNWYFWKTPTASGSDATLSDLQVDGTTVAGFSPNILTYNVSLPYGTTIVPMVTASTTNPAANYVINDATSLPGTTQVVVTSQDLTTTLTYNINFTVAGPEPTTVPPIPPHPPEDVISVYSDAYDNLPGTNYNPSWGQSTVVTVNYLAAGNNTLRYQNLNYQGTEFTNQDVSDYEYLHVDFWTDNSTDLGIYMISPGPSEKEHVFTIVTDQWVSVDISLSEFVPPVNLADVFQFKVEGNGDIWLDNLYFWKSPSGSVTFSPTDGATNVPIDVNPALIFSAPVEMAGGNPITNGDIPSIVTFKETNASGSNVPFTGTIDAAAQVITVIPDADLENGQIYYVALNNNVIKFQSGGLIAGQSITFTTIPQAITVLYENFEDSSPLTWGYWDNQQGGVLQTIPNPALFGGANSTPMVCKFTKEASSDPFTHAFAILGDKLDLSVNNQFQMAFYSETAGTVFALKLQDNDLLAPWTTEVTVEYTIPAANSWKIASFDFSPYADRSDLDKILLLVNPGQQGAGVHYFDQVYGPPFTPPAESPVVVDATTNADGTAIEVQFDKDMEPEPGNIGDFNLYADGVLYPVVSTSRKNENHTIIVLNLASPVEPGDVLLLSYLMSGTVTSLDNGVLQPFENYSVTNTLITVIDLTVLMEGPFNGFNMFAKINGSLPLAQPYNTAPWNYTGTESVTSIPNANVVDWLMVEVRDAASAALATSETMVDRQAAFLLRNGSVVGLDGSSDLTFDINILDSMYVVIWHRNHLRVLSSNGLVRLNGKYSYSFMTGAGQAYDGNQKELMPGTWGMYAGNGNGDLLIDDQDKTDPWEMEAGKSGYLLGDFNLDGQVDNNDKDDYWQENTGTVADEYQLIWSDEFDTDGAPAPDK